MSFITDFIEYDFLFNSLIGVILISLICGLLSPLIVSKRLAFMGSALSHSSLLSISLSLSIFTLDQALPLFTLNTLLITLLVSTLATFTFRQKIPTDSLIGIFLTVSMALGIIVLKLFSKENVDLSSLLFGNVLLITRTDLLILFILLVTVFFTLWIPRHKWIFLIQDEEAALIQGVNIKFYHYLFYILLGVTVSASIKLMGTVVVNTLLLIPGVLALKTARSLKSMVLISTVFSLAFSILGLVLGNSFELPSGATIAVTLFLGLVVCVKLLPGSGQISKL
ncbi:MAG: metal ABC transporter permease [Deltaproteobacteria bacterium]|nr:MAG: metal ABC transporter permease [Deltaproteobacteria bacterium]